MAEKTKKAPAKPKETAKEVVTKAATEKAVEKKAAAKKSAAKKTVAKKSEAKATKGANGAAEASHVSAAKHVSQEDVAALAHRYWAECGYKHGHHHEDWLRAERELHGKAS